MNRFIQAGRAGLLCLALAMGASAGAAEATLNQVYEAVHAGRLNQAQGMMTEVLRDHPNSPKAHYVEAEILAKQGNRLEAQGELNRAEQLAPGLPFAAPASVLELRGEIAGAHPAPALVGVPATLAPAAQEFRFPWGLLLLALAGGLIVYFIVRARRNAAMVPYAGGAAYGAGAAAPYGAPPMGPLGGGIGSGIVGGLVTGAAVGAGMVAGEALAHDLLDGHGSGRDVRADAAPPLADNDLGGADFGISNAGSWDDGGGSLGGDGSGDWG